VWGNPYEVGYAQGLMQKVYLNQFISQVYEYFVGLALDELPGPLPKIIQTKIILLGLNGALDWCADVTAPFTPQEYFDELHGIADASGVDYQTLLRLNLFAEITKASCSFFGAWGAATAAGTGHTYQLRALDYDTVGPFKDFVQITVYHPSEPNSYPFANIGWPGSIGVLSGFSSNQMGISEIGAYFADDSFGQGTDNTPPQKVKGEPWMFILRDVLKYENSMVDAITRIENANRTCNLIIGVGDGEAGIVNGIEYSGYVAVPYNDTTLIPVNDTWHWPIDGVVYNGMDWLCPGYNQKLAEQLDTYHGHIDEVNTVHDILPTVQTGNLHIVVYDLTAAKAHVSFMRSSTGDVSEPLYAYERQFTRLDMTSLFAVPKPKHGN
jgi:isopenicillin-N N-acyltransferase-like protein